MESGSYIEYEPLSHVPTSRKGLYHMTYLQNITSGHNSQQSFFSSTFLFEASLLFPGCYLIHASEKLHHARHYIGWSSCIAARIAIHRKSQGSKLVKAFNEHGISWQVARVWKGETRTFERALHEKKNSVKSLCPICKQEALAARLGLLARVNPYPSQVALLGKYEHDLTSVQAL
jgi:predicted GIY-YIG superfamily endonuclease